MGVFGWANKYERSQPRWMDWQRNDRIDWELAGRWSRPPLYARDQHTQEEFDLMSMRLTTQVNLKLHYAANYNGNLEVGGFGKTEIIDGVIVVTDIIIPPQIVEGAHTDIDVERGDMDWMMRFLADRGESFDQWRLWWHSHANMQTTPSGTDTNTLAMLARNLDPWFAGLVINVRGDRTAFLCVSYPVALRADKLDLVVHDEDEAVRELIHAQMQHVVRKTTPPPANSNVGKTPSTTDQRTPTPISPVDRKPPNQDELLIVNGKPVGQLSDAEFEAWVDEQARKVNAQFPMLEGVRPQDDAPRQLVPAEFDYGWGG